MRERHVVLLAGTIGDEDTLCAYDLASAVVRYGAAKLTWLCPYFGYQTMERAVKPGEVVAAKTRARLLSAVPPAPLGNQLVLVDLHADGIPHYFADTLSAFHIYAKELALEAARAFGGGGSSSPRPTPAARSGCSRSRTSSASRWRSSTSGESRARRPRSRASMRASRGGRW